MPHEKKDIRQDAQSMIEAALRAAQPDTAVKKALAEMPLPEGRLILVAVGKAAWQMAKAAYEELTRKPEDGIVITKHGHAMGPIGQLRIREAGHPVPDGDSYAATQEALGLVSNLTGKDCCSSCPAAALPCLKSPWYPRRKWMTSPARCWPAVRTLWK